METTCPHCGKRYKVPDLAAGKQVRCGNPGCKQTFTVAPAAAPAGGAQP
ncbi:MAG: MJ0042-type zinc finger domain-containing protein, partial [Thermoguttaceae bacterium]